MSAALQILLADDHALLVDALEALLSALGDFTILKAYDWEQAHATAANSAAPIALALLNLCMPGMSGLTGVRSFRSSFHDIRVAVTAGKASPARARAVIEAGAVGFLPKTIGGPAMLHAIRRILAGDVYVPPQFGDGVQRSTQGAVPSDAYALLSRLSERELEVLNLLAHGHSNKEIGHRLGVEIVTVSAHLGSIYRKLAVSNRTEAALKAKDAGLDSNG